MRALLFFLLLLPMVGMAGGTQITASSPSPIPVSFSPIDTQSRVMECTGNVVKVLNQTASILAVGFGSASGSPSYDYTYVPAGPAAGHVFRPRGVPGNGIYLYIRALDTAASDGTVQASCTTED